MSRVGCRYVAACEKCRGYLDSASSEPLHPAARDTLLAALERGYADPRRLHGAGRDARLLLDNARAVVAECLGVRAGRGHASPPRAPTPCTAGCWACRRGDAAGRALRRRALVGACTPPAGPAPSRSSCRSTGSAASTPTGFGAPASVVAVQSANHEVGTVQPVAELDARRTRSSSTPAPRWAGSRSPTGWDALAGSAHKWGGPAGVGVLVVRKGARWVDPFPGDDRVDERATGFENVPAALAAAAALQAVVAERDRGQRPPVRAGRPDPGRGRRRSPTSRSSATRSTGSPTW